MISRERTIIEIAFGRVIPKTNCSSICGVIRVVRARVIIVITIKRSIVYGQTPGRGGFAILITQGRTAIDRTVIGIKRTVSYCDSSIAVINTYCPAIVISCSRIRMVAYELSVGASQRS